MISLKNNKLGLYCLENGKGLSILDFLTGETWTLDENSLVYGGVDNSRGRIAALKPLKLQKAETMGDEIHGFMPTLDADLSILMV